MALSRFFRAKPYTRVTDCGLYHNNTVYLHLFYCTSHIISIRFNTPCINSNTSSTYFKNHISQNNNFKTVFLSLATTAFSLVPPEVLFTYPTCITKEYPCHRRPTLSSPQPAKTFQNPHVSLCSRIIQPLPHRLVNQLLHACE